MQAFYRLSLLASVGVLACGSQAPTGTPTPGTGGTQTTGTSGTASMPTAGSATSGATTGGAAVGGGGTAGSTSTSGASTGGTVTTGGSGGSSSGGGGGGSGGLTTSGTGGSAGGTGGSAGAGDPLDTPPTHTLNVQAAPGEHTRTVNGIPAGIDTRLPVIMGKLIVNVEVDAGGMYRYGLKHGFHVLGPSMFHCDIAQLQSTYTSQGKNFNGDCRLEVFDGVDHDTSTATGHAMITPATSIAGRVKAALTSLQASNPEEDWGYFLAADGSVRWSDVGFTGYSHGASSSARWAMTVRAWRVVARSGPRDNLCGTLYSGQTCKDDVISSWLDETSKTPLDRVYGLAGTTDSEYGDIIFAMERMHYIGALTDISTVAPPYGGSHRLIVKGQGHLDFNDNAYWPAMDVVWAVPQANIDYANSHPKM